MHGQIQNLEETLHNPPQVGAQHQQWVLQNAMATTSPNPCKAPNWEPMQCTPNYRPTGLINVYVWVNSMYVHNCIYAHVYTQICRYTHIHICGDKCWKTEGGGLVCVLGICMYIDMQAYLYIVFTMYTHTVYIHTHTNIHMVQNVGNCWGGAGGCAGYIYI